MHDMPNNVPDPMTVRMERYRQLRERDVPVLFPQGVDVTLDSPEPLDELLASEEFVARCREANEANADLYETGQWTPRVLATGVLPSGRLLVDALCESWLRHLHGYRLYDWEECQAEMRYAIIRRAPDFVPGKIEEGVYEPLSYAAWLNVFVLPSAIRKLQREHDRNCHAVALDHYEDDDGEVPEPAYGEDPGEAVDELALREAVARILRGLPWTMRTLDIVFRLAFEGESMRSAGSRHGISHVRVGQLLHPIKADFVERLHRDYPASQSLQPFHYAAFAGLIGRLFTAKEFTALRIRPTE